MSIMSYSGGTILAMAGNDCVCIASDLRLGEQMTTIATNMKKVIFPSVFQSKVLLISGLHNPSEGYCGEKWEE